MVGDNRYNCGRGVVFFSRGVFEMCTGVHIHAEDTHYLLSFVINCFQHLFCCSIYLFEAPITNKMPRLDLDSPRYDQSTFEGRAKHFFITTNPLNVLASDADLDKVA